MKRIMRLNAIVLSVMIAATGLQGCENMAAFSSFKPSDSSGEGKGIVKLYLHGANGSDKEIYEPNAATIAAYPNLKEALSQCQSSGAGTQALGGIIVPVIGKLLFDMYMEKKARDLEELKEAAEKSYHGRMVLHGGTLRSAVSAGRCFVVTRGMPESKIPDFVSVLALENAPKELLAGRKVEAFAFRPTYVAARTAVAVTRQADKPKISVSFALSSRGIGKQDNGLPTFAQIGETAVTVPNLLLGKPNPQTESACFGTKACPTSDPIPFADENGVVAIGVGVTESGDAGVNFDAAKSELAAMKAAIGPLISDVLKEKLK